MTTLLLSPRHTEDNQSLWRAATFELGWDVVRLYNWRLSETEIEDPVVYVECLFAPMVAEQLNLVISEPPDDWLASLPVEFRKRDVTICKAGDLVIDGPRFLKPPNDKSFPAKVYDELPDYVDKESRVLVQEPVEWEAEFRCFCSGEQVKTLSVYCRDHVLQKGWQCSEEEKSSAKEFAEEVLKKVKCPNAVVMDVGKIKDRGWAAVELNAAWGSGIYGCDPVSVLLVVRDSMGCN